MGAWGYKVLDNDDALDVLSTYLNSTEPLDKFVGDLLVSDYEDEQLLGVAIVCDIKCGVAMDLNDIFGSYAFTENSYIHFFDSLPLYDTLYSGMSSRAKSTLSSLIEHGVEDWSVDVQSNRMNLYYTLMQNL